MSARASVVPVFVPHLGCPHDCVFCNQRRIAGQEEPLGASELLALLQALDETDEWRQLAFYGGSFTAIPVEQQLMLLEAARWGLRAGKIQTIRLSTRPDAIDGAVLDRLHDYGVETIELGAQSMDDEVLRLSGRGHSAQDVREASRMICEAGFSLVLQMMTGLPGDTPEKDLKTARELIALRPQGVRIYPTVVVKDTALFDLWRAGKYRAQSVEEAVEICAKLLPLFDAAAIPVIRLGLNPTEALSSGDAVAGAYHPALGELVKSRVLREKMAVLLQGLPAGSRVLLAAPERQLSQALGQGRCNVQALEERFALRELKIVSHTGEAGQLRLLSVEKPDQTDGNTERI